MHTTNLALVLRTRAALVVCITRDSFECSHHSCFALVIRAFNFTRGLKFRHLFLLYGTRAVEEWLSPRPPRGRILYYTYTNNNLPHVIITGQALDFTSLDHCHFPISIGIFGRCDPFDQSDRRPFHDLGSLGFCHRRGCYWLLFMGLHREPFSGE